MLQIFPRTVKNSFSLHSGLISRHASASVQAGQHFTDVIHSQGVREICLNDAKTRNSLSMDMMDSIHEALTKDWHNKELRSIVLTANGAIWSAGHNLKELVPEKGTSYQMEVFRKLTEIILDIQKAPVPVIAKVNGLAAAAGCQLVASCDIIVATENSKFSTPGVNFGIFCSTPGIAISRVMPRHHAAYMLMTGLPITAKEAYEGGLVTRVVPQSELDAEVKRITDAIQTKSRSIVALGKEFYYKQMHLPIEQAYNLGAEKMTENLGLADSQEGLKSFVEKRKPHWTHE